jgi:predicted dehydrogenase
MCKTAEARDVPLLVGHHRRHNTAIQRARQAIRDGLIGRPVTATIMYNQLKSASYFDGRTRVGLFSADRPPRA